MKLLVIVRAIITLPLLISFYYNKKNIMTHEPNYIYKILTNEQWLQTKSEGLLIGSEMDIKDGYIHLSTSKQTKRIANKYFPHMTDGYIENIF